MKDTSWTPHTHLPQDRVAEMRAMQPRMQILQPSEFCSVLPPRLHVTKWPQFCAAVHPLHGAGAEPVRYFHQPLTD